MGFNVVETAQLLGVCRQTVYNLVYSDKLGAKRITNRMMIVGKENINEFLRATEPCVKLPARERNPISEWYSVAEAMSRLNVKFTKYRRIINENRIPETKKGTCSFVSKKHVDEYLQRINEENEIDDPSNWLTASEIAEIHGLSLSGVYSWVSARGIPKKTIDGKTKIYSKRHIDELKNKKPWEVTAYSD